ncbi:MAG: PKD domain-containing protein [Verrucomicrobia bacterium]|nr:MAG: PKD domain-containing protein [Verrucomicrobiota bacterium]
MKRRTLRPSGSAPALPPNIFLATIASATSSSGSASSHASPGGANSCDSDSGSLSHQSSFGDGPSGSGPTVQYSYTSVGHFSPTLAVTDNLGGTSTARALA